MAQGRLSLLAAAVRELAGALRAIFAVDGFSVPALPPSDDPQFWVPMQNPKPRFPCPEIPKLALAP